MADAPKTPTRPTKQPRRKPAPRTGRQPAPGQGRIPASGERKPGLRSALGEAARGAAPGPGGARQAGAPGGSQQAAQPPRRRGPATATSTATDAEHRKWRAATKRQERVRSEQQLREAREMAEKAKSLMQEAKDRQRREGSYRRHQEYVSQVGPELGLDPGRPVTEVPPPPPGFKQVSFKAVREPFAFVRVSYSEAASEFLYEVLEPKLNDLETEVFEFIRDTLVRTLEGRGVDDTDPEQVLTDAITQVITDHTVIIDEVSTSRIWYFVVRDFLGFGRIDVMMRDPQLEDISCDGPKIPLYLFHREHEAIRTNVIYPDELNLDSFVIRLAQQSGKHISIADPMLDATLPDGSRLQATLSREVTTRGSSFTIRKFRAEPMTPPMLLDYGTMSNQMAAYLWFLMEHGQSALIAGGTASGKTTTLNAVCQFIPPEKKIVSIEDTREINLQHENWIAGVTRTGFGGREASGRRAGSIDMYALLEAALRQRPEYLLVGEVRGPEALTLFQAMATGHAVYSTMHADSAESAVYRLENPPINVPRMMLQTLEVLLIQTQVRIKDRMARRIMSVTEFVGFDPDTGDLLTNTVFEWDVGSDSHRYTGKSFLLDQIMEVENLSEEDVVQEWEKRIKVLRWMRQKKITHFREVARIVALYYHRPDEILERIDKELVDEQAGDQHAPTLHLEATPEDGGEAAVQGDEDNGAGRDRGDAADDAAADAAPEAASRARAGMPAADGPSAKAPATRRTYAASGHASGGSAGRGAGRGADRTGAGAAAGADESDPASAGAAGPAGSEQRSGADDDEPEDEGSGEAPVAVRRRLDKKKGGK